MYFCCYSALVIRRLPGEVTTEVVTGSHEYKFKGRGQKETTLITYQGVLKLIMALPGINAREIRTKFADVIQRYFAGDPSLVAELMENNQSTAGLNALAREDTGTQQVLDGAEFQAAVESAVVRQYKALEAEFRKRRRYELYDAKTAEMRKDKEAKRQIKIIESQTLLQAETTKQVEEQTKQVQFQEQTKQKQVQFQEQTKQLQEQTKQAQEQTKQLELQMQLKRFETERYREPVALPVGWPADRPVTLCRVADFYKLLQDLPQAAQREVLREAGLNVVRRAQDIVPMQEKTLNVTGAFFVNQYSPRDIEELRAVLEACVLAAKAKLKKAICNTPSVVAFLCKK